MSTLVRVVEVMLYGFGFLALAMGVVTIMLATGSAGYVGDAAGRGVSTLGVLYAGLPAIGLGVLSLGLGATVTSIDALRRDTILVATTKK